MVIVGLDSPRVVLSKTIQATLGFDKRQLLARFGQHSHMLFDEASAEKRS